MLEFLEREQLAYVIIGIVLMAGLAIAVLLAVGEHGCHLARPGTGTDGEVGGPVFEPVTPGNVRDLVRGWVDRVVEPVAPDGIP